MVVVTAGRMKDMGSGQITTATTTVGEVTCTDDLDTATLMQQSPGLQGPDRAAMRGLTTGAACWRTSRHLTVLVVALSADGTAKLRTVARQRCATSEVAHRGEAMELRPRGNSPGL
jgi:hypothetical protein